MSVALPMSRRGRLPTGMLPLGISTLWLSLIVLLPLAAVVSKALEAGFDDFWQSATTKQALSALRSRSPSR